MPLRGERIRIAASGQVKMSSSHFILARQAAGGGGAMSSSVVSLKQNQMSDTEYAVRCDLAAAFRLAERFGWSQLVWNHITARVPGAEEHFLINPMGVRWDEISASTLVKVDIHGNVIAGEGLVPKPGFVIHSAIHAARHDGVAVSALRDGLQPICMEALFFHDNIGYHGFEGVTMDTDERARIAASLGRNDALILRNHGIATVGRSVGEAFILMYWLQRACEIQMKVLASNAPWERVPAHVAEVYSRQQTKPRDITEDFTPGLHEWPALVRLLDRDEPSFRD